MSGREARVVEAEVEEREGPTECGDPMCDGHIDDTTGCCILCEVEHTAPCPDCGAYGFHAHGCPERDAGYAAEMRGDF
jgi:hypothetical protein